MKAKNWDEKLLREHRTWISEPGAKLAFDGLVQGAKHLPGYETAPVWQGDVRVFKYVDARTGERPFAFIVNRKDMLFYVRAKGRSRVLGGFAALKYRSATATENRRGEWTVRIATKEDAESLMLLLFARTPGRVGTGGKASEDSRWRTDPVASEKILADILADLNEPVRQAALEILAQSINYAKQRHPGRWVVTLHPTKVRLITGMVMSLQLVKGGGATVLVSKALVPKRVLKNSGEYPLALGCAEIYPSTEELVAGYASLRGAHEAAMTVSATTHAGSGAHRRAHSPGVVAYLEASAAATSVKRDADEMAEAELLARTDITATEKTALVNARRGQGLFRGRLIQLEGRCRVTGVSADIHLRASHIKPWKVSTNQERLDGNNGLLLAPHIDHLFDQGYISFTDEGDMLLSERCPSEVLAAWGVPLFLNVGPFRDAQRPYLAYHRKHRFDCAVR